MILDKARELGIALCETSEFKQMIFARAALDDNEPICALINEFQDKQSALINCLSDENPDRLSVASLSRDVERLQEELMGSDVFSAAMNAQNAFQVLMKEVNNEIASCIGMVSEESGCGGSCEGCSGCKH